MSRKKSSKVIKFLNSARFDIELEIIYYWCIYCMHGETLVIILPFFAGMISFPSAVLLFWVAIWIKPIERFSFHALNNDWTERKRIFMAFEILLNLICWRESPRVGTSSPCMWMEGWNFRRFAVQHSFECQICLSKNFSIISCANTREQWHLTSLSLHKPTTCTLLNETA